MYRFLLLPFWFVVGCCLKIEPRNVDENSPTYFSLNNLSIPDSHYVVYVDSSFSYFQNQIIARSLEDWEEASGHEFRYEIVFSDDLNTEQVNGVIKILNIAPTEENEYGHAYMDFDLKTLRTVSGLIIMNSKIRDEQFRQVVLHEIGHILNLDHQDSESIMIHLIADTNINRIQYKDVVNLCDIWKCTVGRFN